MAVGRGLGPGDVASSPARGRGAREPVPAAQGFGGLLGVYCAIGSFFVRSQPAFPSQ
jgi:hypothetical protein